MIIDQILRPTGKVSNSGLVGVEAGTRCVTLGFSRWDHHGGNFAACRQDMPMLDQGLSALIDDIYNRGLDRDVSVVVWGEFGRTPKINKDAGRDHWPQVGCALLAGGGMKMGQVIGTTDRLGGEPTSRPVHFGSQPRRIRACRPICKRSGWPYSPRQLGKVC